MSCESLTRLQSSFSVRRGGRARGMDEERETTEGIACVSVSGA